MNLKPTYSNIDFQKFIDKLLASDNPKKLLANCNLDANFFERFKRELFKVKQKEINENGNEETKKATSLGALGEVNTISFISINCDTPKYQKLNEIEDIYKEQFDQCINRLRQPTIWSDNRIFEDKPCCQFITDILQEFKEKFNPNDTIYYAFFKCFYYHSLTDFDNFRDNNSHIKVILEKAKLFEGKQKEFFLEKISADAQQKNQKIKYAERVINFEKELVRTLSPICICTAKEFKTDLSELCENCPLPEKLKKYIELQVLLPTRQKKEVLLKGKFIEYVEAEIQNASKAMGDIYLLEIQNADNENDQYRANRTETYIWNRERIKALNSFLEQSESETNQPLHVTNPEFTTSRQVLAIYYLLEYFKVDFKDIDRTNLARFTQFLTGKEANNNNIANTNIYKKWGNLFGKTPKKNKQDLIFIKTYFGKLRLMEIVKMIENDSDFTD